VATAATKNRAPADDLIEVLLTPSLPLYMQMGEDIERIKRQLGLPKSASNTQVIAEVLHRQAQQG
jgi:hypothetical protein